jgi:hypothetical protein
LPVHILYRPVLTEMPIPSRVWCITVNAKNKTFERNMHIRQKACASVFQTVGAEKWQLEMSQNCFNGHIKDEWLCHETTLEFTRLCYWLSGLHMKPFSKGCMYGPTFVQNPQSSWSA